MKIETADFWYIIEPQEPSTEQFLNNSFKQIDFENFKVLMKSFILLTRLIYK